MKRILLLTFVVILYSCESNKKETITATIDYDRYLATNTTPSKENSLDELDFWNSRLSQDSIGIIEMSKLSGVYNSLFSATGDVTNLHKSEELLKKAYNVSARDKDTYLRSLAHNYISQHRFKEAKTVLDSANLYPDNKRQTELMLFDVYMELGEYSKADSLLGKLKNASDYNYLIRLSKWSDYKGDLDAAIRHMEKAKDIADAGNTSGLRVWTYSNIADYYGHAGRIEESYNHYLKTLEIEPDNAYAKKGIAWILYSKEKNTKEANRILDSIMVNHKVPDYYLLKAEMAEFENNKAEADKQINNFINAVEGANYGGMYNTYLIEIYSEKNPEKALALAKEEVGNRATPETYQLLALAQLQANQKDEALTTIKNHVEGKTFEPMALYHSALVYKANGLDEKVTPIKEELLQASFELGPVLIKKIEKL